MSPTDSTRPSGASSSWSNEAGRAVVELVGGDDASLLRAAGAAPRDPLVGELLDDLGVGLSLDSSDPFAARGRQRTWRAPIRRMSLKLPMYCEYASRLLMLSVTSSPPVSEPPDQFWEPVVTFQEDESPL